MLPARHRLGGRRDFGEVIARGVRVRRGAVVVHVLTPRSPASTGKGPVPQGPVAKAGFVVSRAVGGSVTRHTVVRRLRAVTLPRLATLAPGTRLVVRALPESAAASSQQLAQDLDAAIASAQDRQGR